MKLTKSQAQGFITALLGLHAVHVEDGDCDFLSPLVAAYLSGVLPEMPSAYGLNKALNGKLGSLYASERDVFCDFLEAVVAQLRGTESAKESLPWLVKIGEPRTPIARFEYADQARNWADENYSGRYELVHESEKQS